MSGDAPLDSARDRPPRLARWLLERALPPGVRGDAIRGDLLEELRSRSTSPARASWWYSRQALSLSLRYGWDRARQRLTGAGQSDNTERSPMFLESIWQDVRYAVRSYVKAPSFTLAVMTTLALGIGASTAIFSMVDGILLRPLPLPDSNGLIYASETNAKGDNISLSWPNYVDWRARAQSFEALADSREEPVTLTGTDRAARLRARRITGNFFRVIRVQPVRGRGFTDEDDRPNATPVAIVTDAFWRTRLGSDPEVVGRVLKLDDVPYTIVGVLPQGFEYVRPYDLFLSMGRIAATPQLLDRGNHMGFYALGRLKPGVTLETATEELRSIAAALEKEYPNTNTSIGVMALPLVDRLVTDVRLTLLALLGAVGFLLLIACVNVANLLIARGAARQHELVVRAALGGGRVRLASQLLVESTLISIAGGVLGVAIASGLLRALVAVAPENTPRLAAVQLDSTALFFAFAAAAVCGVVFGAFPALQASGVRGQHALVRGRAAGFSGHSHRLRRGLMVVETALALILLTGAGLMMRTLQRLTEVDTGFRPDHLLTTRFTLGGPSWTEDRRRAFYDDVLLRVRALPGVTHAALAVSLPIDGSQWNSIFTVADKPVPPRAELPSAAFAPISAGYFETMGTRVIRGRPFDARDTATSTKVLVVNEALAKKLWPGEDPVGKRLKQGWPETPPTVAPWREVIGVVADVKLNGVERETPMQAYLPLTQEPSRGIALVIRTATDPGSLGPAVDTVMHQLDKDLPLFEVRTMDQVLDASLARQRMSMVVFVVFAIVALTLASVGLYGVVAHGVTERTHEIGVRIALGAEQRHVLGLVIRQGLSMAVLGTVIGVAGALAVARWIEGLLFGVTATDPATIAAVVAMLLTVALVACYVPAWRATRVDPTQALRTE
jgi:putative ABC transport system permease protein